ncbi:TadE/TadG family type IV pilus assembly protein [Rhodophyticola sp. SM2404]
MAQVFTPQKPKTPSTLANRFVRAEDGTVTIFGLIMFVIMIAVGGVAIDILRYETQRVQMQYTLDRAVLAAASLDQNADAEAVVRDYFARSELENYRLRVTPQSSMTSTRVEAFVEADINLLFMNMFGVNSLTSPASAVAEESVETLEISLALDVSGSMGGSRIVQMRDAAEDFVVDLLAMNQNSPNGDTVSISLIPYNGRVNIGTRLASVFTLSDEHDASNCARFPPEEFHNTAIDPETPLARLAHADYYHREWHSDLLYSHCYSSRTRANPNGGPLDRHAIIPWSSNQEELVESIRALTQSGWTAMDLGMKWAVGLLDPVARPALSELIDTGAANSDFEGRPFDYDNDETLKVIVLMTDGENSEQHDLWDEFRHGPSNVFYHDDHHRWSIFYPGHDRYWIPEQTHWWDPQHNQPNNYWGFWSDEPYRGDESEALDWLELFGEYTAAKVAAEFYLRPAQRSGNYDYFNWVRYAAFGAHATPDIADANTRAICDAARAQGIIVFTIGFQAPRVGQEMMQYCATTPAHYYPITYGGSLDIADAFASIATSINRLRLVQ